MASNLYALIDDDAYGALALVALRAKVSKKAAIEATFAALSGQPHPHASTVSREWLRMRQAAKGTAR